MKKTFIFLLSTVVFFTLAFTASIKANTYFSLQYSSNAYYLQNNQSIPINGVQDTTIPYGTTIQINYTITNQSGSISSYVTIIEKEGLTYFPYYEGVLKVNGRNVNEHEYSNFITNGNQVILSSEATTIQIHMKSTGSYTNKITTDLKVYSNDVTSGAKSNTTEHAFYYNFGFQEKYTLHFYDDAELIQSMELYQGSSFQVPSVSKEGYQFIGFNTKKDGSGEYLQTSTASSNNTYYAIYERKTYQVRYFVNDELYAEHTVNHGEQAPDVNVKMSKFLEWDKDLSTVVNDIDTYAIFSDSKKEDEVDSDYEIIINKKSIKANEGIQKDYTYQIFYEDQDNLEHEIVKDYEVREVEKISSVGVLLLVLSIVSLVILLGFKKVKK